MWQELRTSIFVKIKETWPLSLGLLLLLLLRIPNFFEPYWYGDEGIYLTLGNALRQGRLLYAEIIDHKTPLIYYLAMVPHQLWFRVLNVVWMTVTTIIFWDIVRRFITKNWLRFTTLLGFILLTTLPWFEGHIPNGELFVMGFVLAGLWLLMQSKTFTELLSGRPLPSVKSIFSLRESAILFGGGILFGLGILTKIPGLLDFIGILAVLWMSMVRHLTTSTQLFKKDAIWQSLLRHVSAAAIPFFGAMFSVVGSVIYYATRGTLESYLQFGLLYNFRYAGSWELPFSNDILLFLFTLPGKLLLLTGFVLLLSALYKWLRPSFQLSLSWLGFALVAATLSNRPYPHYFLQVIPALFLSLGILLAVFFDRSKSTFEKTISTIMTSIPIALFIALMLLLDVGLYETSSYYRRFGSLATGQISHEEYRNSFNYLMDNNYSAADIIAADDPDTIFIWGTNPMLYALTDTAPSGRFTVAFHIHDFEAYEETMRDVREDEPQYIVIMDHQPTLEGLPQLIGAKYTLYQEYDHFTLWKHR